MCRACVSPVLNHPSLFESPTAFTGLGAVTPNRRGFMALSTAALLGAGLPVMGAVLAEAAAPGLIARTASTPLGLGVLVVSVAMQALGIVAIRRIAAIQP